MQIAVDADAGSGLRPAPGMIRTEAQLAAAIAHIERFDAFTVDVETDMELPVGNSISWIGFAVPDRVFVVPMGHPLGRILTPAGTEKRLPPPEERRLLKSGNLSQTKKTYPVPATYGDPGQQLRQDQVFGALRSLLFSKRRKIGHNLKFDLESIAKYYGGEIPPGPYADTLILTHILDENLDRYGLKDLVMDWLEVPKKERKAFYPNLGRMGIAEQPIDQVARYLAKDCWYTHLYYQANIDRVRSNKNLLYTYWVEMQLYPVLMRMELTGVNIDVEKLRAHGDDLRLQHAELSERIWTICGEEYEITNVHKKRHFLFDDPKDGGQGLAPLTWTEKTNTPQLNTATLEHYKKNELARLYLDWADKEKLIGTFITGLEKRLVRGRLHTSFNQHRTVTGRLSSNNPNLQQIPRGELIRETFVADPDHILVVADYDQIELRCAAYLSEDAQMIRVFQEGQDIHTQAASAMFRVDPKKVSSDQRQVGKTMNFGTLYGAGPDKIVETANCTVKQAQEFIRRYYTQFSGLSKWKDRMIDRAYSTGGKGIQPYTEIPPWYRKRRLPELYSHDLKARSRAKRQVVNAIVQGFASNIMKLAMIDLHRQIQGTPYELLLNVHDELILQTPVEYVDEARDWLVAAMEGVTYNQEPILGTVPLTAAAGVGNSWSAAK